MAGFGGIFGSPLPAQSVNAFQQPEQKRFIDGGKFRGKDALALALGAIGDAFTGRSLAAQNLFGSIAARREAEQAARLAQQKRITDFEDFQRKRQFELANPVPDAFDKALRGAGIDPASPEGQALFRDRAASLAADPNDQFVSVNIPGLGTFAGPKSGLANFVGGAPERPVGKLTPIGGASPSGGPIGDAQQPQMVVTPMELNALVQKFGPDEVQRRLDSGIVAVREN